MKRSQEPRFNVFLAHLIHSLMLSILVGCGSADKPANTVSDNSRESNYNIRNGALSYAKWVGAVTIRSGAGISGVCTGTLITPVHVLTARHCIAPLISNFRMLGSTWAVDTNQVIFTNERDIRNWSSNYIESQTLYFPAAVPVVTRTPIVQDVAIIRLRRAYPGITQAQIPVHVLRDQAKPVVSYLATIFGFGQSDDYTIGYQRRGTVKVVGQLTGTVWYNTYANAQYVTAPSSGNTQLACPGDSGSPLIIYYPNEMPKLVGVLSSGTVLDANHPCTTMAYNYYTNIANFGPFIDQVLAQP